MMIGTVMVEMIMFGLRVARMDPSSKPMLILDLPQLRTPGLGVRLQYEIK